MGDEFFTVDRKWLKITIFRTAESDSKTTFLSSLYENMSVDCVVGDELRINQMMIKDGVAENGQIAVEKFVSHEPEYYYD